MGNYHLNDSSSPAHNFAAASETVPVYQQPPASLSAPAIDIDDQIRPADSGFDIGADEYGALPANPPGSDPGSGPTTKLYLSLDGSATLPGASGSLSVSDEDILGFDGTNYSLFFDGSDVGLSGQDVDGFAIVSANTVLLSFRSSFTLSGVGSISDSDVVQFTGTLGDATSGTFSLYFDASDVGLTTSGEDVDAVELLLDGSLVVSTTDNFSVPGVSGADEDLVRCVGTFGPTTTCTWSMYLDGSDIDLSSEDVDAAAVASNGDIYLSTEGSFSVTGASGADEDVFVFTPSSLGSTTSGTYAATLFFKGSDVGVTGDVDALDLP